MSGIGQETNNIRYVTAGTSLITMADDIINCDSAQGAIILVLPNIQGSGILSTGKCFKINDTANTAATHNITIVGVGGNKVNDASTVVISTNGQSGYVKCLGLNDYLYDSPSSGMVGGFVGGSGTLNFLSKWTPDGVTIGNSQLFDNGTNVGLNTILPTAKFHIKGSDATSSNYALKVDNLANSPLFHVRNDGEALIGGSLDIKANLLMSNNIGTIYTTYLSSKLDANSDLYLYAVRNIGLFFSNTQKATWYNSGSLVLGITDLTEDASALIKMSSTTQGFLMPRMSASAIEAISSPAEGLLAYSADGTGVTITTKGWWGWTGATWEKLN